MRTVFACSLGLGLALAGCKPSPERAAVDAPGAPDAFVAAWWTPEPGEVSNWDIQLAAAPFDIGPERAMYTIDLWDAVPAATAIDYGDGAPVTVRPGAHATAIAMLHARTPRPIVVCHVGTGSIRLDDPDAMKFPGYAANPPNRDTPPAAGSVIGWSPGSDANERFLDLRTAQRAIVKPLIEKRIALAKQIECDAVAADRNESIAFQANTGFTAITLDEYTSWSADVTGLAHARELSIGMRNRGTNVPTDDVAKLYDWMILDRCAEFELSPFARPFLNASKAVFALEYDLREEDNMPNSIPALCSELATANISDEIVKTTALDSAFYMQCP